MRKSALRKTSEGLKKVEGPEVSMTIKDQNLNERQASEFLKLKNHQTLANWRFQRKGPAYCRVGRRIIYRMDDLEAYLKSRRVDHGGNQ
jgi:hypothetical protein